MSGRSSGGTGTLRRVWWIPLLTLVVAVGAAFLLTRRETPRYRSTASVVVVPNGAIVTNVRDIIDSLDTLDRRTVVATLARLAYSKPIVREAAEQAGIPDDLRRATTVRTIVLPNTNIVEIEVTGPDPKACADLANAVAHRASSEAVELYQAFRMKVLDEGVAASRPVSPDVRRSLTVAAVLGALGGAALAVLVEWLRRGPGAPAA